MVQETNKSMLHVLVLLKKYYMDTLAFIFLIDIDCSQPIRFRFRDWTNQGPDFLEEI